MSDLFISYKSEDRPWAERLYRDLRINFPFLEIFWDRKSIQARTDYRDVLEDEIKKAQQLVLLASKISVASPEVVHEVEVFKLHTKIRPFLIQLDVDKYPGLETQQNYPQLNLKEEKKIYREDLEDRGVARLALDLNISRWNEIVTGIGGEIFKDKKTQPVGLAVLCTYKANVNELDKILDTPPRAFSSTLRQFLDGIGLNLQAVKDRYGEATFDWKPFGTNKTIEDLMKELQVLVNSKLPDAKYQFHFHPIHLVPNTKDDAEKLNREEFKKRVQFLIDNPSIVLIDPISLYETNVRNIFEELEAYRKREESVLVWLAPWDMEPALDWLYRYLSEGNRFVEDYFYPQIPAVGGFPRCGVSVNHQFDLMRLIRGRLGSYFQRDKEVDPVLRRVT